jgi:hypothetical protein
MKKLVLISCFLFLATNNFAQTTKIKIKKAEPMAKVTLACIDTGIVQLSKILADKKLVIANNKFKLKIYSYEAVITGDSVVSIYEGKNEQLPKEMIDRLTNQTTGLDLVIKITRIVAYNEFNETINLNEIDLKVIK